MNTYLVTGGGGFIGSNIAHELVRRGEKVRIIDNFSTGNRKNISDIHDDIELIEADIRDLESVWHAVKGIDFVLHQAALPSVARSVNEPITSNEVNTSGTLNMLVAARDAGVKRFIFATSSSIYGDTPILPKREDMVPSPLSPYAVTKLIGEHYCRIFYNLYGLETMSLRYFNVFGPGQDPSSQYSAAIPKFINAIIKGELITIYGDGEQSRDFTYVQNVVNANLLACEAPNASGDAMNIACGNGITLNQLISTIEIELGIKANMVYEDAKPGDVKHSRADISKAQALINYNPLISFEEGLAKTIKWFINGNRK
jgi:nucleoside-diphosphate-sugar epimerase